MTLQTLLNQAVSLHRDGKLAEAEGLYRQVLAQAQPNFTAGKGAKPIVVPHRENRRINVTMLYGRRAFYGG